MRLWTRRPAEPPPRWEDLVPLERLLRSAAEDVLAIETRQVRGGAIALGGRLRVPPGLALDRLRPRLAPYGYTPFLREEQGLAWVRALALAEAAPRPNPWVNLALFLATVATTWLAGGAAFAASLLLILGVHELGHYTLGRRHGMPVTLPYFIPVPPVPPFLLGTLGAVIRLRGVVRDRRALFDMAVAGPLAGLAVAVPILVIGLRLSSVAPIPPALPDGGLELGDSLLLKLMVRLVLGPLPEGHTVFLHPVGVAAWFGFFVTALNLIPAGQLDGGHVVYALLGQRHALVSKLAVGALVAIGVGFGSANWLVWAVLIVTLMGFRHGPTMDDITPLDPGRRALGVFALVLLLVLLPPVPIGGH